ncbi:hypothetical protein VNO80_08159 [Phaseolus coccineus]|uniref:Uncharacterized protein n=1 Tax=Phaseolus coccineus TaxID=3886 RepID=A0AAN9NPQ8_PHACN
MIWMEEDMSVWLGTRTNQNTMFYSFVTTLIQTIGVSNSIIQWGGSILLAHRTRAQAKMVMMGLGRLVGTLKSKIRSLKLKKPYDKMEKSDSMRVEIRSRKAKKLIEETLKIADSPKSRTFTL